MQEVLLCMLDLLGANKTVDVKELTDEVISILDSNKDGKVSKNEFIDGVLKNFSLR
jgi:hypothetical protein